MQRKLYLVPGVQDEFELGGWGGVEVAQCLQGFLLCALHLPGCRPFGLVILSPAVVVVHVPFQRMFGMLPLLRLLIVLSLLFG